MPEAAPGGTAAGVSSGGDVEVVRKEMFSGGTTSPSSSQKKEEKKLCFLSWSFLHTLAQTHRRTFFSSEESW